jgi:glycerol-3-phosphate acyltransferase PlsY
VFAASALLLDATPALVAFAGATALLIVFTHRANLARLRHGNENRFEQARLLARWRRRR